jgi:hypothetical protein
MHCSRPTSWILALVYGAFVAVGCTATTDTSQGETGSLTLNLEVGSVAIDEVDYLITGNGMDPEGGTIDTSAPGSTASVEVFGLLPGDYAVTLSATATDRVTMCQGSEDFSIQVDGLTEVMVYLRCKLPETLGGVRVNGKFNVCAVVNESVVKPLQTSVGNDIDLSAMGEDAEGDDITYIWSGTGGDIDDPNAMDTTYTCEDVGQHSVTITVSDDGFEYCMDSWTTVVTCVEGDGNLCDGVVCVPDGNECTESNCDRSDGICKDENVDDGTGCDGDTGMCMDGECVDVDQCQDVDCDDEEECTDDSCTPLTGNCINAPVNDGTDCDGGAGMCVDGECIAENLCDGVTCEDTGNECTVGVCNMQTGVCNPMDVPAGTECNAGAGACSAGECVDNNMCEGVDCTSAAECVNDGTCHPADGQCIPGSNKPADASCTEGGGSVCDDAGVCVACNSADQCTGGDQCNATTCVDNACGTAPVMDGTICDFNGADGVCEAGACVEAPQCNSPGDCDDGTVCTTESCVDGMCGYDPDDGAECDAGGIPGLCEAGACVGLCEGQDCTSDSQCVEDGTCNDQTGNCVPGDNSPQDQACTEGGGAFCDGSGNCVECNNEGQCSSGQVCTENVCMSGSVDYPLTSRPITVGCSNNVTGDVSILTFTMDVGPMLGVQPGLPFSAPLDGVGAFTESFLDAAQAVVPGGVRSAQVIGADGVAATVAVRSGATGADVVLGPDFTTLDNRCDLTGSACDPVNDVPGNGNTDCIPQGTFNNCLTGFADVPVQNGTPNSAGGCTQPAPSVPVPDCNCTACDALDATGCRPGDPDVPCVKGDQCTANGFCVTGDLPLALTSGVGNYTAGSSGSTMLFGWFDGLAPPVAPALLPLPAAVFSNPAAPMGIRVSAGGLFVALQCLQAVDSGGVNGVATCQGGPNAGLPCFAPSDNSNNACDSGTDAGLACSQTSATACTVGVPATIGCVNADCGSAGGIAHECAVTDLASTTPDSALMPFVIP